MIQFTGTENLYIAIANKYGLDKKDWSFRINWAKQTMEQLESIAHDADEPFLFLKAVRALRDTQAGIPTGYIMDLDACSSGVQILSVLMGCSTGAANCGLINTGKREDFYTNVTTEMNRILGTNGTWKRPVVKDAAMTVNT